MGAAAMSPERLRIAQVERAVIMLAQRSTDNRDVIALIANSRRDHPFPFTPRTRVEPELDFDFVDQPGVPVDAITNARPVIEALRSAESALQQCVVILDEIANGTVRTSLGVLRTVASQAHTEVRDALDEIALQGHRVE